MVDQAASELSKLGACWGIACDLSTPESVAELVGAIKARTEQLHVVVNNAGKTWGAPLDGFPDNAWASVMAVNVQIPFTLVRDLLPLLEAGRLDPVIGSTYALEDAAQALLELDERRAAGKVLLTTR